MDDGKTLIDLEKKLTYPKIHPKGGPTQARGKAEILTAWASLNPEGHARNGNEKETRQKNSIQKENN